MTFQQIQYVLEIARLGSINKASAALYTSQSNVSNALKELERQLGISIFVRTSRGVRITERGREFISYIHPIAEQMGKLDELYSAKPMTPSMRFYVSTQRYPFVARAFIDFLNGKDADKYEVKLKETDLYKVIEDVYENRSDIGIIFLSKHTERMMKKVLEVKKLQFHALARALPHTYLSTDHPLAKQGSVTLSELTKYPYIAFGQENNGLVDFAEEIALLDIKTLPQTIYVYDRATFYNIVTHTDGFSIGSGIIPTGFGDAGIVTLPISDHTEHMQLGWIKRQDAVFTRNMEDFTTKLEQTIPK